MKLNKEIGKKTKKNFIVDARCDGVLRSYTVKNVSDAQLGRTAIKVAESLFMASSVFIINKINY